MTTDLTDLLRFANGEPVCDAADWQLRRDELASVIIPIEYGAVPHAPERFDAEIVSDESSDKYPDVRRIVYRLTSTTDTGSHAFALTLLLPLATDNLPLPVVLCGDGGWEYVTPQVTEEVLQRGYILAVFDREEVIPDRADLNRTSGIYPLYPGSDFGAIAGWAWGYHRSVDTLLGRADVHPDRIAIVGHSRGGKAVLLAGATDKRIASTAPNCSGCGGAGSFKVQGAGSETLEIILHNFPFWFAPDLADFIGREDELPFDQHFLKALVAPRALLSTEALGDLWANPSGSWATYAAAREVYKLLNLEDRIGIYYRNGEHTHSLDDWQVFLDFADTRFGRKASARNFNHNPFVTTITE